MTHKTVLMPSCLPLSIIRYVSRVSRVVQGKESHHPLHFGVVAIYIYI